MYCEFGIVSGGMVVVPTDGTSRVDYGDPDVTSLSRFLVSNVKFEYLLLVEFYNNWKKSSNSFEIYIE